MSTVAFDAPALCPDGSPFDADHVRLGRRDERREIGASTAGDLEHRAA